MEAGIKEHLLRRKYSQGFKKKFIFGTSIMKYRCLESNDKQEITRGPGMDGL